MAAQRFTHQFLDSMDLLNPEPAVWLKETPQPFFKANRSYLTLQHFQGSLDCYCKTSLHIQTKTDSEIMWQNTIKIQKFMWRAELHHMASSSVPRPNRVHWESRLDNVLLRLVIEGHMVYNPALQQLWISLCWSLPHSKFCFGAHRMLQRGFLVRLLLFLYYSHWKS